MRSVDFVVGSHMYPVARSSDSALTILTMMILLQIQILHYDDDDDGRSSFHRPVKGNSIIKSDDDDQRFFHRPVNGTSIINYDDDDDGDEDDDRNSFHKSVKWSFV